MKYISDQLLLIFTVIPHASRRLSQCVRHCCMLTGTREADCGQGCVSSNTKSCGCAPNKQTQLQSCDTKSDPVKGKSIPHGQRRAYFASGARSADEFVSGGAVSKSSGVLQESVIWRLRTVKGNARTNTSISLLITGGKKLCCRKVTHHSEEPFHQTGRRAQRRFYSLFHCIPSPPCASSHTANFRNTQTLAHWDFDR